MNAGRIRESREQAATDRLLIQAGRAQREAAAAQASLRRRPWPRWWTRRTAAPEAHSLSLAGGDRRREIADGCRAFVLHS
jgi:hypothetical protein